MKKNKLYVFIVLACFAGYAWLFFLLQHQIQNNEFIVCLFKKITHIPCPSCGTTRAVVKISKGEIISSLFINPFGIIVALTMLVCPFWIGYDFLLKKDTFFQFYKKMEEFLRNKKVYVPLLILVLLNWIWNINKNL